MPIAAYAPPHNVEAECTVIGALLIDPDKIISVVDQLRPQDFYDPVFRTVYEAMCELHTAGSVIDFVTVSDRLKDDQPLNQLGGSAFLTKLAADVPTSSHAEQYAQIVREHSKRRDLVSVGQEIAGLGFDTDTPLVELVESVEKRLLEISTTAQAKKPQPIGSHNSERYEHYTALLESENPSEHYGIRTGFADIDEKILGLKAGNVLILAGQTSSGKTAVALEFARRISLEQRKSTLLFSLEMSQQEIYDRMYASVLEVEEARLSKGDLSDVEASRMGEVADRLATTPLFVDDDADKTLCNLRSKARQHKIEHGLDLLIVDYIQMIRAPDFVQRRGNRTEEIRFISENLKGLARELECPLIVLSQLSRAPAHRTDKEPQLSDLRDSGSLEQDADFVLMLYREALYANDPETASDPHTDLFLRKNRPHGRTGRFRMKFDKKKNRYFSVDNRHDGDESLPEFA